MRSLLTWLLSAVVAAATATPSSAETSAEARGYTIATEIDRRDSGFTNNMVRARMILRNRQGDESMREMRFMTLEEPAAGKGDKTLVIVDEPADVDGTVLLTHANILAADDQWIYLPALKRVKRISSVNKSGPFMGSEFAFEDMGAQDIEEFTYTWLRDEPCAPEPALSCSVIERHPKYEYSGYTRQVVWVDLDEYRIQKIDYFDRKDALLKTLTFHRYGRYLDKFWRAHELKMVNHQSGKETTILTSQYQFQTEINEGLFDKNNLDRVR